MTSRRLNRLINLFTMILIGVGFYFLFRKSDWSKVVDIKNNISIWGLVAVLALFTISQLLMIIRWYLLLIPIKSDIQLRSVFRIAVNAIILNQIAPGKVGYPTKAYFLKQAEGIPISLAIPSLVGEVFLDYSITGIFLMIAVFLGGYLKSL
ncbi:MAG: flippase-like domain-containing protein, partial [candidate division KSB1 bacterium]|nr:flippase-like domain-containing protein [candidate division KSB1 bacterium]